MPRIFLKNIIIISLFLLSPHSSVFSQEQSQGLGTNLDITGEEELTELQKQARSYRSQGLEEQSLGNLDSAVSFYQKAVQLDPLYAVPYNDLGVIYEAYGWIERAEEAYLQAVNIDPQLLSAYSNLALLYEDRRDLNKAFLFWMQRAELGSYDDPWTEKAQKRLEDIMLVVPGLRQVYRKKIRSKSQIEGDSKRHLGIASRLYEGAEYQSAIDELNLSLSLNPQNLEAEALLEEAKTKLQEQEAVEGAKRLHQYFQEGKRYYQ